MIVSNDYVFRRYIEAELSEFERVRKYSFSDMILDCCTPSISFFVEKLDSDEAKNIAFQCSINIRKNSVYEEVMRREFWRLKRVNISCLLTGGIVGMEHININNRHRITDLAMQEHVTIPIRIAKAPYGVLIGIPDETPIEDDDVSQNILLIDGAHRCISEAKLGKTVFTVCVGC